MIAQKKHSDFEAAVVIQRKWLFGDDTPKPHSYLC